MTERHTVVGAALVATGILRDGADKRLDFDFARSAFFDLLGECELVRPAAGPGTGPLKERLSQGIQLGETL